MAKRKPRRLPAGPMSKPSDKPKSKKGTGAAGAFPGSAMGKRHVPSDSTEYRGSVGGYKVRPKGGKRRKKKD